MNPHQQLEQLLAKQAITEQIHRYCRAIDRCDGALLSSVFHDDATHAHGPYQGPSAAFCSFALELLAKLDATQHLIGNVLIELIDDNTAFSESCWTAFHRIAAGVELPAAFADHDQGLDEDVMIGGRYIDRFERRDGIWKIAHRIGVHDWQRWMPSDPRGFLQLPEAQRGARGGADLTYRFNVDGKQHIFLQSYFEVNNG